MARKGKVQSIGEALESARGGAGDNSDEALKGYIEKVANCMQRIDDIRGEMKDILNEAKHADFLKTAIRKAVRNLRETEEQRQARKEVEEATVHYTEVGGQLQMFDAA